MANVPRIEDSFSKVADSYQKFRPGYPKKLYETLTQFSEPTSESNVLDVGCGTGNVTRELAKIYPNVYGIDPSEGMLEQACCVPTESINPISWKIGVAENLPFSNQTLDLITVAQAFHWFNAERFLVEAKRVLKPEGIIAIFAEGAAPGERFRSSIHEIIRTYRKSDRLPDASNSPRKKPDQLLGEQGFSDVQKIVIDYELEWDIESFIGFMNSMSMMADFNANERQELNLKFEEKLEELIPGPKIFRERNLTTLVVGKKFKKNKK